MKMPRPILKQDKGVSPFGATCGSRLPATADSVGLFGGFGSVPFVRLILSARRRYQSDVLFGFGRPKAVLAQTDRQHSHARTLT